MKTVYKEISQELRKIEELQGLIKEKAAIYAANKILDIEALIIKSNEPKAVQYMIDQILHVTLEVARQGVGMNLLAKVKRAERKTMENLE